LIDTLNSKNFTVAMMLLYHGVVLTLSAKYIGLALMLCFILMIYWKLYCFDQFMKRHQALAEKYKKDPETI
jgi:hypothetical protein